MSTLITDQGAKDVIVPGEGQYFVTYKWVLDSTSLQPVGVRVEETHTS